MGKPVPKYARVAAAIKGLIADGTLRPGQPAPSGAALSRVTGYSTLTCRRALRVLVADGVLTPGPSRNARPRVAGPQPQSERDFAAAARALSAGLATRRHAHGFTQPELAVLIGVSVTTIGHAETGRLWQSRQFWEHADAVLDAGGDLLKLHDAFSAAGAAAAAQEPAVTEPAAGPGSPAAGETAVPGAEPVPGAAAEAPGPPGPPGPGGAPGPHGQPQPRWQGTEPGAWLTGAPRGAAPACVMIMWGDGTVTTIHPPAAPSPDPGPAGTPGPGGVPPA